MDKPWFVFGYYSYYPAGGMQDFRKAFATKDEAKAYVEEESKSENKRDSYDIVNVLDYGQE
jgi:hypothetical protein